MPCWKSAWPSSVCFLLAGMPLVERFYTTFGHGFHGILLRGVVSGICLLPPTLLMGATLPAIARWVETTPQGVSWLGFFYGGNIAGAVCGCLLAGFYLLRVHDMAVGDVCGGGVQRGRGFFCAGSGRQNNPRTGAQRTRREAGGTRRIRAGQPGGLCGHRACRVCARWARKSSGRGWRR